MCAAINISLSLHFNGHFPCGPGLAGTRNSRMSPFWILLELMVMEVVTTGAIRRAKLKSKCHHQQTNTQFFYRPNALSVAQPTVLPLTWWIKIILLEVFHSNKWWDGDWTVLTYDICLHCCQDFHGQLYESYYLNFISAISRQKLEDVALAAIQTNVVTQVSKVFY